MEAREMSKAYNHTTKGPAIGTVVNPFQVGSWEQGFVIARDLDRPVVVSIGGRKARVFPSGKLQALN